MKCRMLAAVATAALLATGCDHKELCFDHTEHSGHDVRIRPTWMLAWEIPYERHTDWETGWKTEEWGLEYASLNPSIPEGLRVVAYSANNDDTKPCETNISADGDVIAIPQGRRSLLFYNNDSEFITIDNEESFAHAMATTRARSRQSYPRSGEETVAPPDMLFGNRIEEYYSRTSATPDTIDVTLRPLTFTYLIRYEFEHGLNYIALARGALSGMARGVYLHSGVNSDTPATLLFDCYITDNAVVAEIKSFGLPGFPNRDYGRSTADFILNLEVKLYNGKTLSFDADVSEQVTAQPYGGVIIAKGFEIPDDVGDNGGSGFTVDVQDWGDEVDVDLDFSS